ncbi:uncharacterized protein [Typha angustifolia]|uniref:uncharacterized protein isoform X2 n=1 Tax=Typha angustifolia TaxID=59011 RepID=UPI003C2D991A
MESFESTPSSRGSRNQLNPNLSSLSPSPSPSPSPSRSPSRLWRPAAQRNLRNQWSKLLASKDRWLSAASEGRSHATGLVNAYLSRKYMPEMDLGVLRDMPEIRQKACEKLSHKQELCCNLLLSSYKNMVLAASHLVKASDSMRCFLKVSAASPLLQFSDYPEDENDIGDGGGIPVFSSFSISDFESLARELVEMFIVELSLKRILVLELLSVNCKEDVKQCAPLQWLHELYHGEFNELRACGLQSDESCQLLPPQKKDWQSIISFSNHSSNSSDREVLQVYLTTWLANVSINMSRISEICAIVEEEMQVKLS